MMGGSSSCAKVWSGVLGASANGSRDSGAKDLGKVVDIRTFLTAEVAFRVGDKSNLGATGVESASEVGVAIAGQYECGGSKSTASRTAAKWLSHCRCEKRV